MTFGTITFSSDICHCRRCACCGGRVVDDEQSIPPVPLTPRPFWWPYEYYPYEVTFTNPTTTTHATSFTNPTTTHATIDTWTLREA
jgi:hypothetical protein